MSAPGSASRNTVSVMVDVGSATVSYTWSGRITDAPMARESMTAPIVTSTVPTDPATVSVSPTCQPFGSVASSWTTACPSAIAVVAPSTTGTVSVASKNPTGAPTTGVTSPSTAVL